MKGSDMNGRLSAHSGNLNDTELEVLAALDEPVIPEGVEADGHACREEVMVDLTIAPVPTPTQENLGPASSAGLDPTQADVLRALGKRVQASVAETFQKNRGAYAKDRARYDEVERYRREEGRLLYNDYQRALYANGIWDAEDREVRPYCSLEGLSDEERDARKREKARVRQQLHRAGMTLDEKKRVLAANAKRRGEARAWSRSQQDLGTDL